MRSSPLALMSSLLLALGFAAPAHAFDGAVTHAGLTEQALLASSLPARLAALFGLPLGIYETLRLQPDEALAARLDRLDAAQGYAPRAMGTGGVAELPAVGWLLAGSAVEEVPALRERNHYFDPTTGRGLTTSGSARVGVRFASVGDGLSTLGELFRGRAFDGTGTPSTQWLSAPGNDLGERRFLDARERAVVAAARAERQAALAEALLAAGAMLHVIEDAADPAYVHNDYRVDQYRDGAPFDAFVRTAYDRLAIPPPAGPARPVAHLTDLIHASDGSGLADRTARRFYSVGLLAADPMGATRPAELTSLRAGPEPRGYLQGDGIAHLARWWRDDLGAPRWELDTRCYRDYAAVLLPEAGQAALSALEHLFRDELRFDGDAVKNGELALGAGKVTLLAEDAAGRRRVVTTRELSQVAVGATLIELPASGETASRYVVVFRGVDRNGEPLVTSVEQPAK